MSLASLLLKSTDSVDSELDALFKSPQQPQSVIPAAKKRKTEDEGHEIRTKRSKIISQSDKAAPKHTSQTPSSKQKIASKLKQPEEEDDGGDNNSDLEASYLRGRNKPLTPPNEVPVNDADSESDEEESNPSDLVHESLTGTSKAKSKHGPKQKYTPPDETPPQRDQRTIFIGNLPLQVAQKRVCVITLDSNWPF